MKFVEWLGCISRVVQNGEKAVAVLQQEAFDLTLMDCQMSVMDGLEATERSRSLDGHIASTLIIALTANALDGEMKWYLDCGINDYLSKPLKKDKFEHILNQYIVPK